LKIAYTKHGLIQKFDWKIIKFLHLKTMCDCPICFDEITEKTGKVVLSCSHSFHLACITEWFSRKQDCPCCRAKPAEKEKMSSVATASAAAGGTSRRLWEEIFGQAGINRNYIPNIGAQRSYDDIYINTGGGGWVSRYTINNHNNQTITFNYY
jgi:hypothetical protein